MEIKIKKLVPGASIPERATEFAGGWDAKATDLEFVYPDLVIYKLGFALELPPGYKVTIVPRSSITKTGWIMQNSPGLGDPDYRGEYQIRFRALPKQEVYSNRLFYPTIPYKIGERVGQIYIEKIIPIEFIEVENLSETNRGSGGFGHTGN